MQKGYKVRLYPTKEQQQQLNKTFGCARFVYNHFLAERQRAYKEDNVALSYNDTAHMLVEMKRDPSYSWLNEVDSMALQESLRNLDRAFQNFFQKKAKYPRFHSKKNDQSYRTRNQCGGIRIIDNKVRIPVVGFVKCKGLRSFEGRILNASVSLDSTGAYYLSLCVECEDVVLSNAGGMIGIDVGIKSFYTDSNGNEVFGPQSYKKHENKLKRAQRKLSRAKKGSKNRDKQRKKLARCHKKVADIRKDFLHKTSAALANENQVVCAEHLNVKNMLGNHRLAKQISDQGWSSFYTMLNYKVKEHGGTLIKVPTFYPSSQTCSCCGYQNTDIKNLNIRNWVCPNCGSQHNRDHNAAINILNKGLEMLSS